jgi:hypothetical protein
MMVEIGKLWLRPRNSQIVPERGIPEHSASGSLIHLDFETLGQIIPDRCVPTMDRNQAVDNQQLLAETLLT